MKEKTHDDTIKKEAMTPMMKQYFDMKADYPEALLLFRCGDFYETYGDDAVTASKILGIVLTKRSSVSANQIPMAGVPFHALDAYLPKLVRAGYKVAICDQLEDPKLAKGLVKRGVSELITPGVAFDDQLLRQKENNYIVGLCYKKDKCGAAFLDVSTGSFQVTEGDLEYISGLLSSFSPKELLVERGYERGTKERFGNQYYVSTVDEWAFNYDSAVNRLCSQLKVGSLKGFAVGSYPLGISAAGALLVYLEQTQHSELSNICTISRIEKGDFVWMDRFTMRNLEIFASAAGPEGTSLVDVIDECRSPMGARMLRMWLAMPSMDISELNARYDCIDAFRDAPDVTEEIRDSISDLGDLERMISRAATGKINPRELLQLGRGLSKTRPIAESCASLGCDKLNDVLAGLSDCGELAEEIRATLAEDPASLLGKGDVISSAADEELASLRSLSRDAKSYLAAMQQRETERTGIPSLKVGYNNVFGYYFEVRNTHKDKVPEEWVRKQTLVSAERYITEELKEYEQKILGAESRIYEIESRIYRNLVSNVQANISAIQNNSRILARIDLLSSFAVLSQERNYCRPQLNDGRAMHIKAGRHPVIETLMPAGEEYVPNDIEMDSDGNQIMILTGPNMAGKSALLRQTALIVLLAQVGCFVPATQAELGICDKLFTRVGASDNISRGESTFMVEMLETSMILHNLSPRSLVLLDEIGRGTSTYDGMSIARAIVEYIHRYGQGAKTLFATHYHELNDLENIYPRVKNYHIAVKEVDNKVIFLRKLREGGVAHSFGIHVARMAGMPRQVVEMAEATLKNLESSQESTVSKLTQGSLSQTASATSQASGVQLSFFQLDDPLLENLRDDLNHADLNNMTPLQAFDLLRSMKEKLGLSK